DLVERAVIAEPDAERNFQAQFFRDVRNAINAYVDRIGADAVGDGGKLFEVLTDNRLGDGFFKLRLFVQTTLAVGYALHPARPVGSVERTVEGGPKNGRAEADRQKRYQDPHLIWTSLSFFVFLFIRLTLAGWLRPHTAPT